MELPDKPLSENEKRAANWKEKFGREQTEIDAMIELYPEKLEQAIRKAIAPFYDFTLKSRVDKIEEEWREEAGKALREHPEYSAISETIEDAYKDVEETVEKLRDEQERAAEILRENLPEPPELPDAEPNGTELPPLFDSSVDFVTATRRLIADKKLAGNDDNANDNDEAEDI